MSASWESSHTGRKAAPFEQPLCGHGLNGLYVLGDEAQVAADREAAQRNSLTMGRPGSRPYMGRMSTS